MPPQSKPVTKAFLLAEDIRERPPDLWDILGAGMRTIRSTAAPSFPSKHTFWVFLQLASESPSGKVHLALTRADSGRRYFFRDMKVEYPDPVEPTTVLIRVLNCEFPDRGIYFLELWYDGEWLIDQRLQLEG
jgi:hypothetical protein